MVVIIITVMFATKIMDMFAMSYEGTCLLQR